MRKLAPKLLPQRLGSRLKTMVALTLGLTIVLFGTYSIHEQSAMALKGMERQADALSQELALMSENLVLTGRYDEIEDLLRKSMAFEQVLDIQLVDPHGASLSHVVRPADQPPRAVFDAPGARSAPPSRAEPLLTYDAAQQLVVAWHPITAGKVLGWVRVCRSTQTLEAIRERIWLSTLVAGLLASLTSAFVLTLVMRTPLRAIQTAKDFAVGLQRIRGQQIEGIEGPHETVELALALNQASSTLYSLRNKLESSIATLRSQEAVLADTNEQLRTIFSLSPDALVSIDETGCVRFANDAFFHITGLQPDEVIDQPESLLDEHLRARAADPLHYVAIEALFQPLADPHQLDRTPSQLTLEMPCHTVLELVGRLGNTPSVSRLLYVRDITRESEIDRMKSEFLSTAAHELRTPMTGIHSCVELMMEREFTPDRRKQLLGIVHRQSQAMIAIVNELLDLARIEDRQGTDFELETNELDALVARAVEDFVAPDDRPPPELQGCGVASLVRVDSGKLAQVVRNLLSNAYKYSSEGAAQVCLLSPRGGPDGQRHVGFTVQDHGIGMTPEQLARICERFYRADATGQVLGTGLGMSIVKDIVELMGGFLEMTSELARGTSITVWLPLVEAPAQAPSLGSENTIEQV